MELVTAIQYGKNGIFINMIETDKEKIERLEKIIEDYACGQIWYSEALEQLCRIRYDHGILLDRFMQRSIDGYKHGCISDEAYDRYINVQDSVNKYFTPAGRRSNEIKAERKK